MARRKKTASMPQADKEKLLKKAIVSEDEQPYKVPGNWCWTYIKGFAECLDSFRQPVNTRERSLRSGDIPYYGATGQVGWIDAYLIDSHVVLLGEDGAPFLDFFKNKAYIIEGKSWVNNHAHILRSYFGKIGNAFLMHYLNVFDYSKYVKGSTRLKLTQSSMNEIPVPLPPLQEQQRIVERIESLFSKLDAAKERIQNALDGCELRKAAILKKAFNGELTEKWRKEHGEDLKSWSDRTLKECGTWHGGGTPSTSHPEYWENGKILWITSKDMKSDLIEDTIKHINMLGIENSAVKYNTQPSVLFVTRSGILRRTLPISMVKKPFTVNQDLKVLTPSDINLEYLFWACKDNEHKMLEKCMKTGTTVENINTDKLMEYTIPIAPILEQLEIVQIINNLLEKESKVKEAAEQALRQIEYIKKSILAKAFRGELGTNDPQEESSLELLKQIIETGNS